MAHSWNEKKATEQIEKRLEEVEKVEIVDYVKDMSLNKIPVNKGYRVHGTHMYADILNLDDILETIKTEGITRHRRALRFLNQHYRAVSRILSKADAIRVDFHNQRLHSLITKPYNSESNAEAKRIHKAIAIAQMIIDVLQETGKEDEHIPNAKMRVGIDSGKTIAVNNGRSGNREPLFLGEPANQAAKISGAGEAKGIFLTNTARKAIGLEEVETPKTRALTKSEIEKSQKEANLDFSKDEIIQDWKDDLKKNPIGSFEFSRHTPPFNTMKIAELTPANSRRQEAVSIYADIDGFTAYVKKNIDDKPENVIKTLHVIRSELERVLTSEFKGRRIRFIGDCLHGLICEGTSQTTDIKETISTASLCVGGLRSSFDLAIKKLNQKNIDVDKLGLQIGFEYGWMTVTRLGLHGDKVRCSVSRGVLESEKEQLRCNADETAIGANAYDEGTDGVRNLFGKNRKKGGLDYNEVVESLNGDADETAKNSIRSNYGLTTPAIIQSTERKVTPYCK